MDDNSKDMADRLRGESTDRELLLNIAQCLAKLVEDLEQERKTVRELLTSLSYDAFDLLARVDVIEKEQKNIRND